MNGTRKKTTKQIIGIILAGVLVWMSFGGIQAQYVRAAADRESFEGTTDGNDSVNRSLNSALINRFTQELEDLADERDIMALVYLCDEWQVRREGASDSETAGTVSCGHTVFIRSAAYNEQEGKLWIYVEYADGDSLTTGYIEREKLACSDERFADWERRFFEECIPGSGDQNGGSVGAGQGGETSGQSDRVAAGGVSEDVAQFPESYQAGLMELKTAHPGWIFVPMKTGLDYNTVITEELKDGKSLVYKTFPDYTKNGAYDDGNWFYATREILEYYMDPRNSLTEDRCFQFELLTYNATYHTEAALENFLNNTFMKSPAYAPGTTMTYAHIIWAIGAEEGREVSPFHLASRIYQEQGQGKSPLISGTYPGYEGYYNYFNVKASGKTTEEVIVNGLTYAKQQNWNSAYYSILGGADIISANYIKKGQDTLYLQKFNVNPAASNPLYTHQYMQNIAAPVSEGNSIKKLYASADSLDNSFVFKIPVYNNMPAAACPYPTEGYTLTLDIPSGYQTTVWVDGVAYSSSSGNNGRVVKLKDDAASTAVVYSYTKDGIPSGMYIWTLNCENKTYTATAQAGIKDLFSYHGFSIRVSGEAGMRVKTGIDVGLKKQLTGTGVNGYRLKEYGTLRTDQKNLTTYPLVLGGDGVVEDMAYGQGTSGMVDSVFETVTGRDRFAAVLTGLSEDQYRTVYSFRPYAVLSDGSRDYVIYGPTVAKSLTALASQVQKSGVYEKGTAEYQYLTELIQNAK